MDNKKLESKRKLKRDSLLDEFRQILRYSSKLSAEPVGCEVPTFYVEWYGYTDKVQSIRTKSNVYTPYIDPVIHKRLARFCIRHRFLMTDFNMVNNIAREVTINFQKI